MQELSYISNNAHRAYKALSGLGGVDEGDLTLNTLSLHGLQPNASPEVIVDQDQIMQFEFMIRSAATPAVEEHFVWS